MTAQISSAEGQPVRGFATACDAAFKAPLAAHGFTPVRVKPAKTRFFAQRIYRAGDLYVRVSTTTHPRDAPAHCALALGEGSHEFPDGDWNAIALWQLATEGQSSSAPYPYPLREIGQLPSVLQLMNADLQRTGTDFLVGDLRRFRAMRARVAASRSPYTIWSPAEGGRYLPSDDPDSTALRARYAERPPDGPRESERRDA